MGIRDRAILAFFLDTGCRLGGLLSLTLDTLNIEGQSALIIEKGNKERRVYFSRFTAQLLLIWLAERKSNSRAVFTSTQTGKKLSNAGVAQILERLKERANVTGRVNPHAFRHGFARMYIQNGGDISTLASILGHSSISTTVMFYAVFSEDELQTMHKKHSPMNHINPSEWFGEDN